MKIGQSWKAVWMSVLNKNMYFDTDKFNVMHQSTSNADHTYRKWFCILESDDARKITT